MRVTPWHLWLTALPLPYAAMLSAAIPRNIAFLLALGHGAVLVRGITSLKSQFFGPVYWKPPAGRNQCALTFDDGPDSHLTPRVLELLGQYDIKATFFVVAQKAEAHPDITRRIIAEGHCLAMHDLTHSPFSNFRLSPRIRRDLQKSQTIVYKITGCKPRLYRPPFGLLNPHYHKVFRDMDLDCIGWSWAVGDGGNRYRGALRSIAKKPVGNDILLLHDGLPCPENQSLILQQVEQLLRKVTQQQLDIPTVDRIFSIHAYR